MNNYKEINSDRNTINPCVQDNEAEDGASLLYISWGNNFLMCTIPAYPIYNGVYLAQTYKVRDNISLVCLQTLALVKIPDKITFIT